jgi:hypothetical protein
MILHLVRVLALLAAACLAPSLAHAHAGHMDHARMDHARMDHAHHASAPASAAATAVVEPAVASAPSSIDREGCLGHCCGAAAGMPCCGVAALVPEISAVPDFPISHLVWLAHAMVLFGLPPEALPKPPKLIG